MSNAYNDYGREIVVAHDYGWDAATRLWLPFAVDASGHQQVDVGTIQGLTGGVTTPSLYSVTMTLANTEYSQAMPANCRRFEMQCRAAYDTRIAYVTGKVATPVEPYWTLKAARADDSGPIAQGVNPSTLYFACATAGQVMSIRAWT